MAGLGNAPLGTSPFGIGTPAEFPDPVTGLPGSRYINPLTRSYEYDATTGQLAQMPILRQRVLLAVMTEQGSSSVLREFGIRLPRKMDQAFERSVQNAVRSALRHLTEVERVMRIDGILLGRRPGGRATVTIAYTDTTNGQRDQATVTA